MSYVFCPRSFYFNNKKNLLAKFKMKKVFILGYSESKGVTTDFSGYSCVTDFSPEALISLNNKIRESGLCLGVSFHEYLSITATMFIEKDANNFFDVYFVSTDDFIKDWPLESCKMKDYKNNMSRATNSFIENSSRGVLPQKY